ncbi:MAG: ABC transporter permease [Ignavibacteria bacterium]|jgi:ABC-2 type transport system permease protein|nr:ABC transporter permease [Ignavibacteria bacterium]
MQSKIWTIIKHEYLLKVRSKGFIIGTIVAPIGLLLIIAVPGLIAYLTATSEVDSNPILIKDNTGLIAQRLISADTSNKYANTDDADTILKQKILDNSISAALIIDSNAINTGIAHIMVGESTGMQFIDNIRSSVNVIVKDIRLQNANIDSNTIKLITADVHFETAKITAKGTVKDDTEMKTILSYVFGFIMYGLMFMYGGFVMQGVLEEKTNRIVEVLASSATPFQIMFGKVVGIGAVGLSQIIVWIILGSVALFAAGAVLSPQEIAQSATATNPMMEMSGSSEMMSILNDMGGIPQISIFHILAFLFYFLSGYFIFSTLFAAAASTVDQIQDSNSLSMPLSMFIIIPILLISNVTLNPEGTVAVVTSLFPLFTPILMTTRIISISVPVWQIALSVVLEIATFLLCLKFAAKIYRIGMLKYGKKANFKDIIQWALSK